MFEGIDAYPLSWPVGWKRTPAYQRDRSRFVSVRGSRKLPHTMAESREFLLHELWLLGVPGASSIIISTNVELRKDGLPMSGRRTPEDPGVAVYFILDKKPFVLACDKWDRVEDNLWAIGKHVEALRGQERWGVGTVEQAFTGYQALPAPVTNWWEVLGVDRKAPWADIQAVYRIKVKLTHPDNGGNQEEFLRVQAAYEAAEKEHKA